MRKSVASFGRLGLVAAAAGLAAGGALAQQQNSKQLPDAQVESNVLRALASAPELSTQNIQTSTTYGVVTLSGNVHDETLRTRAENLAARANGVTRVVDQMTLGDTPPQSQQAAGVPDQGNVVAGGGNGQVLQSDGTYAPAVTADGSAQTAQGVSGVEGQAYPAAAADQQAQAGAYPAQGPDGYPQRQPLYSHNAQQAPGYGAGQGADSAAGGYPDQSQAYPGAGSGQPPPAGYPNQGPQAQYPGAYGRDPGQYGRGGQVGGRAVLVPAGAPLQIRINRGLRSDHVQPGTPFTAQIMSDVVADGAVAIPRGATVTGVVVDAEKAGALKGRGELALQLTGLTLGGRQYALVSSDWVRNGDDKTKHTVNSGIVGGVVGALFGAAIGGGEGAAIGAGVGGAAGVASSAASPNGNVAVPPEALLNFKLTQPLSVLTVGQGELQRLAYAAGPYPGQPARYYRRGGDYPYAY